MRMLLIALCMAAGPAHAQEQWSATSNLPHDVLANCLADKMRPVYHVAPVVSAPPRREAQMLMWVRGREHLDRPVAWFTIDPIPAPMGGMTVRLFSPGRAFGHFERAKEAGRFCSRFAL